MPSRHTGIRSDSKECHVENDSSIEGDQQAINRVGTQGVQLRHRWTPEMDQIFRDEMERLDLTCNAKHQGM